jgi:PHD/YefM family antitoxin component YafN of YafNO toxin-antitoxin module
MQVAREIAMAALGRDPGPLAAVASDSHQVYVGPMSWSRPTTGSSSHGSAAHVEVVLDVIANAAATPQETLRAQCEVREAAHLASDLRSGLERPGPRARMIADRLARSRNSPRALLEARADQTRFMERSRLTLASRDHLSMAQRTGIAAQQCGINLYKFWYTIAMANPVIVQVHPLSEVRARLSGILARFRREGAAAEPVAFGSHRKPEAILISYEAYERYEALARQRQRLDDALSAAQSVQVELPGAFSPEHDREVSAYVDGEISAAELYRRTVSRYRRP